ncbi:MAG TPA: hypothetical protein VLH79_05505 [Chthonomonadales bacterium]|nr:hypothetical protein [Chthonomonadales bacterium]
MKTKRDNDQAARSTLAPIGLTPEVVRRLAARFCAAPAAPPADTKNIPRKLEIGGADARARHVGGTPGRILKLAQLGGEFSIGSFPGMEDNRFHHVTRALLNNGWVRRLSVGVRGRPARYEITPAGMEVEV